MEDIKKEDVVDNEPSTNERDDMLGIVEQLMAEKKGLV